MWQIRCQDLDGIPACRCAVHVACACWAGCGCSATTTVYVVDVRASAGPTARPRLRIQVNLERMSAMEILQVHDYDTLQEDCTQFTTGTNLVHDGLCTRCHQWTRRMDMQVQM